MLHDPRHRGLICFEEPENGVHPARIRQLVQCLRDMVTVPCDEIPADKPTPLSQLLVNSHSPVVLAALVDRELHPVSGSILFADTATVTDPEKKETRRRTRLRSVRPKIQNSLPGIDESPRSFVSDYEVQKVLETVEAED